MPLSRQALNVLGELKSLAGDSRYVLPGRNPDKPISNNTMLFALYRLGYKRQMTGHGFRAIASTLLNEPASTGRDRAAACALRAQRRPRCIQPRRVPAGDAKR